MLGMTLKSGSVRDSQSTMPSFFSRTIYKVSKYIMSVPIFKSCAVYSILKHIYSSIYPKAFVLDLV